MDIRTKLTLRLQMFGKLRDHWHEEGKPVRRKVQVGEETIKSGRNKGKKRPVFDWVIDLKKQKVQVGERELKSGKNKGKKVPIYETELRPYMSTGYFPSNNAIYYNVGGGRRLNAMAEAKLDEWREQASLWAIYNKWNCAKIPNKVILNLVFYLPDEKIRDTHNAKKLLFDALEGVIHENDMYFLDRTIDFKIDPNFPRIEIEVLPFK